MNRAFLVAVASSGLAFLVLDSFVSLMFLLLFLLLLLLLLLFLVFKLFLILVVLTCMVVGYCIVLLSLSHFLSGLCTSSATMLLRMMLLVSAASASAFAVKFAVAL